MAINGDTLNNVRTKTTGTTTTEADFRDGLDDVTAQVNTNQTHMNADRTITLSGDVTGTLDGTPYQLNTTGDYSLNITTTYAAQLDNANITDNTINASKLTDSTITNAKIASGTISQDKIASSSKNRLTIYDTNGSTVLFQGDTLSV